MAHRMAFPANRGVPLAVKVSQAGDGWLIPYDPIQADSEWPPGTVASDAAAVPPNLSDSRIDVFALDVAPFDGDSRKDALSVKATFHDSLGRRVEIRSVGLAPGRDRQHFGGVGTNLFLVEGERWTVRPLLAWGRFDVRINGSLTDSSLLGSVVIVDSSENHGPPEAPALSITLYPTRVGPDGSTAATPVQAAEDVGMAGWRLFWDDVTYYQAPVLSVRAERGDSLEKIAKDLSVDPDVLSKANSSFLTGINPLRPGDLIYVPLLIRATTPAPRKVYPSVSLSWKEIMNGWTTLN